jgi:hypothetical protein
MYSCFYYLQFLHVLMNIIYSSYMYIQRCDNIVYVFIGTEQALAITIG